MKVHDLKQCPLSKSNIFDQNFMEHGHIVSYQDVFFKFHNGPYRNMLSVVMALCLWKFTIWNDVRSLTRIFYQNFMKLGYIVKYHNVFFNFNNGPYRTRLSVVMALSLWKFTLLNDIRSLTRIFLIRSLWNLVTLFSTMVSSSCLIMVHIAPCFQELWPFVYENSPFETMSAL